MTGLRFKPGVKLYRGAVRIQPEMALAANVVEGVFRKYAEDCWITSALEGRHSTNSLHYKGLALDFRTRNLSNDAKQRVRDEVASKLGEDFDVVLESTHLHVEFDPE